MTDSEEQAAPQSPIDAMIGGDMHGFDKTKFKMNVSIFDEGDEGDAAYLILKGKVEIRKGVHSSAPQLLATLTKGEAFGEMALFDDSPRMAQALAKTDVMAIRISRDEFLKRLQSVDPVMRTTILYMVRRVRDMADEFMRRKGINWQQWRKDEKPEWYR